MTTVNTQLLDAIARHLMESPRDQVDILKLTFAAIADRVLDEPNWLPSLPAAERTLIERVLEVGVLASGSNDGPVH
jgi:hypothetical protein